MLPHSWSRSLPALAAIALLCLAATTPPRMPASSSIVRCDPYTEAGSGDSTVLFANGDAVRQPLPPLVTVAACSVRVVGTGWNFASVAVKEWDPLALAPDPETIALRTAFLDPSRMDYYSSNSVPWTTFEPPIVTGAVAGVAEPPRSTLEMEVVAPRLTAPLKAYYEPEGNPAMPPSTTASGGGTHDALQGSHPVLAHAFCAGEADLQSLRVAQCVRRTDVKLLAQPSELLQRFRVPERVELRWVELAVDSVGGAVSIPPPAVLAVVDAAGFVDPPATMPAPLVEAAFEGYYDLAPGSYEPAPRWASHLDFDHTIVLEPGQDYGLYVRSAGLYRFLARALTGGESAAFTAGIGAFHTRATAAGAWSQASGQALAFRLVGLPQPALVSVPPLSGFDLRVSPNPTPDLAEVRWSGAVGPVKLEIFDARGRRVATKAGGAAGDWGWEAKSARGQPLPAGVYFVHARDSQGARAVERVVLVR